MAKGNYAQARSGSKKKAKQAKVKEKPKYLTLGEHKRV